MSSTTASTWLSTNAPSLVRTRTWRGRGGREGWGFGEGVAPGAPSPGALPQAERAAAAGAKRARVVQQAAPHTFLKSL
jgi:hypothetical protein